MTKIMWKEIDESQAESLSGGKRGLPDFYLGSVNALQVNAGNGIQNNYYVFTFINVRGRRHR
jgi:hypothetical protein